MIGIAVERDGSALRVAVASGGYVREFRLKSPSVGRLNKHLGKHRRLIRARRRFLTTGGRSRHASRVSWRWCFHGSGTLARSLDDWHEFVSVDDVGSSLRPKMAKNRRLHDLTRFGSDPPDESLPLRERAWAAYVGGTAVAGILRRWNVEFDATVTPQSAGIRRLAQSLLEDDQPCRVARRGRPRKNQAPAKRVFDHIVEAHRLDRPYEGRSVVLSGGQSEAFGRGLYDRPVLYADIEGSYLAAAIMTPLPVKATVWRPIDSDAELADLERYEGFAYAHFEFPRGWGYPSLPIRVQVSDIDRPLTRRVSRGSTWATLAELRAAASQGASIAFNAENGPAGYVFEPGPAERDHRLHAFCWEMLRAKNEHPKDSPTRQFFKMASVATIGKLAEQGREGGFAKHAVPEWNILIVGTARALAAQIVAVAEPLLVLTDGFLFPAERWTEVASSRAVTQLSAVGSGLRVDHEADAALVLRSQAGALLARHRERHEGLVALARDDRWSVTKVWQSSVGAKEEKYAEHVLALARGEEHRIRGARALTWREAERGKSRQSEDVSPGKIVSHTLKADDWGHHRALDDRDAPLTRWNSSRPYQTLKRALDARRKALKRRK